MKLEIKEILKDSESDDFVKESPNSNFMQSWNWSMYQQLGLGRKTFRLGLFNAEELVAVALCYEIKQTFGKYIYCSRGPILKRFDNDLYKEVLNCLIEYFNEKGYIFFKIDPAIEEDNLVSTVPLKQGFKICVNYVQPETPWFTELKGQTEEQLLEWCKSNGMGKNYPTYIRKARKEGVHVRFSNEISDWEQFTYYLSKSADAKDFVINDKEYYLKQLRYLGQNGEIRLAIAEYEKDPIAMLVLSFWGNEVSCLYSCQTGMHDKIRGAMLLRWECMLQAQREGFKYFNSWDVLPDEKYIPSNPRYGYSNFKRGFGGYIVKYQRTMDYPFDKKKYFLVRVLDMYRKVRYYRER